MLTGPPPKFHGTRDILLRLPKPISLSMLTTVENPASCDVDRTHPGTTSSPFGRI